MKNKSGDGDGEGDGEGDDDDDDEEEEEDDDDDDEHFCCDYYLFFDGQCVSLIAFYERVDRSNPVAVFLAVFEVRFDRRSVWRLGRS